MSLNFNPINLAILFGAVQGFILSFVLFYSKDRNQTGGYFLGYFMLALAYNALETFLWSAGFDTSLLGKYVILFELFPPFVFISGLGPSLYLYTQKLIHPEFKLRRSLLIYYLPVLIQLFLRFSIILYLFLNKFLFHFTFAAGTLDSWHRMLSTPVSIGIFWVYLFLSISALRQFLSRSSMIDSLSKAEAAIKIKWLKALLIIVFFNAVVWSATVCISSLFNMDGDILYYYPLEVLSSLLMYWIAFAGYHKTKIIHVETQKNTAVFLEKISPQETEKCSEAIHTALAEDKLYLDPYLSVHKLAAHIDVAPKLVSAVMNQYLKKGFSECINTYRVEEVKRRLLDPTYSHLTILAIALESGFNSQATFQRAFKSHTGVSPKEFLAAQPQKFA
jgi:AraC-like DNA-binding protein